MRPLTAQIHLDNLRHNYRFLKSLHGQKVFAVVKADAYGHGAVQCARALDEADGFCVAMSEEAAVLRQAGIRAPIVLLEGVFCAEEYHLIDQLKLSPVVQDEHQLRAFLAHHWQNPPQVWLKMNSGMNRAGFTPAEYPAAYRALAADKRIAQIVKITHLADADNPGSGMTAAQIAAFDSAAELPGAQSLANSAGIMYHPAARRDIGRAGIALYGVPPSGISDGRLKPVMTLATQVFSERCLKAGDRVGYNATYTAAETIRAGIIACGYADGYPRRAPNGTEILVDGQKAPLIGRISMDMMMVALPEKSGIGSTVELWGENLPVNQTAAAAQTIGYELLCAVKRARFVYR